MASVVRDYEVKVRCWEVRGEEERGECFVVRRYGLDVRVEAGGAEPCVYVVDGGRVFEIRATELVRGVMVAVRGGGKERVG